MKKIKLYIGLSLLIASSGCNKYLDKEPDNRAKLVDARKVAQLLATAYPRGSYMAFNEALSDNSTDKGTGVQAVANADPYFFADVRATDQDSPEYYWNRCYEAIASANHAIEACSEAADAESYNPQKGEALLARAYAHFMLVTLFAKPYEATTAAANKGVPYVTAPETEVIKQYDRHTVEYVYSMIEKDILAGLPLIDDRIYAVPRYHFNRSAANAFAARFYLYKKDYQKVLQYAQASVPTFLPNLRAWNTTYKGLQPNEIPQLYQRTTEPANLLLVSCPSRYGYNYNYATYRYGMNNNLRSIILRRPIPVTGGIWAIPDNIGLGGQNVAVPKLLNSDFAFETPTSDFGLQYSTLSLLTTEEVLFNKVEANIFLNKTTDAINDLNTYMSTRITDVTPGSLPTGNQITETKVLGYFSNQLSLQDALLNLLLIYKRTEFVHEGMRWFDLLRFKIPVTHQFLGSGGAVERTETLGVDDKRRQLKIPDGAKLSGITDLNR